MRPAALRRAESWGLVALVVVHVVLGLYYSAAIPIWEAHDEDGHYDFVRLVASERRLPRPGERSDSPNSELHQPPLYYLLAAIPVALSGAEDGIEPLYNPHMSWPNGEGGLNRVIHDPAAEGWPYQGTTLAIHAARFASILIGALGLIFTFLTARVVFPDDPWVRWGAVLICAFWPQYRFSTAVVNNDILVTASASAVMWLMVRSAVLRPMRHVDVLGLLTATALALLSKNNALALLPLVPTVLLYSVLDAAASTRRRLWPWLVGGGVAGVLAVGWWYTRNAASGTGLFGGGRSLDWLLHRVSSAMGAGGSRTELLLPALNEGLLSLWAGFGWNNVTLPRATYAVAAAWGGLGLGGLLLWVWKRPSRREVIGTGFLAALVMCVVAGAFIYRVGRGRVDVAGRYLLPALPAICILLTAGWSQLLGRRTRAAGLGLVCTALALLALLTPSRCIQPAYALPPTVSKGELPEGFEPVRCRFGELMELVGYRIEDPIVDPTGTLEVTLVWQVLARADKDYTLSVQAFGQGRQLLGEVRRYPGRGALATSSWMPGQVFREEYRLPLQGETAIGAVGWLEVSLFDHQDLAATQVTDAEGRDLGPGVRVGRFKVRAPIPRPVSIPSGLEFGAFTTLVAAEIAVPSEGGEGMMGVRLDWLAAGPADADYTVSLQLRNSQDTIVGQIDEQPRQATNPTTLWEPGEVVTDLHSLSLSEAMPEGVYTLYVCLYDLSSRQRVPVLDPQGQRMTNDEVPLVKMVVRDSRVVQWEPVWPSLVRLAPR